MPVRSTKYLLFGILLILFGGVIMIDPTSSLPVNLEVVCVFVGLVVGLVGFFVREQ